MNGPLTIQTPAKVNLFLEVLARRPDGYHDIATLMLAVDLFDTLELEIDPSGEVSLACDRPDVPTGSDNLVCRAAQVLRQRTGHAGGVRVRLSKQIPSAAGLAGGSSDAAAALIGLDRLWQLGLSRPELAVLAAELGSDVAFFLNAPAAWCTGRGEVVEPIAVGRAFDFVLVCPPAGLSTARVYGRVRVPERPLDGVPARAALQAGDVLALGRALHNRLQPAAEELLPEVARLRRRLEGMDCAGCQMSGSGSSVFALCRDRPEAQRLAERLREQLMAEPAEAGRPGVFVVRSCV